MDTQQTQQIIDMVQNGIDKLSTQMGVTLPHLWEVMIKQQYVYGAANIITFLIILAVSVKLFKNKSRICGWFRERDLVMLYIISALLWFLIAYVYFELALTGIGQIINPEYYAMKDIANFIK